MMSNSESDLVEQGTETELEIEPSRRQLEALRTALTSPAVAAGEAYAAEALPTPVGVEEVTPSPGPIISLPPRFFAAPITGIERTQATQFFSINGKGSGNAAANSVPLVANKDLILRVYVRKDSIWWPHVPTTVTGKVSYPGHPDLPPLNGPINALQRSVLDRNNANHTLNFRVPAAHCVGTVNFKVNVWDPAQPDDASASLLSTTVSLTFDAVPRVRVHGVLIHYTGKGLDIAAPTGFDLVNTLAWVGKTYPVSGFNYTACDVVTFSGDLTVGGGGGCGTGWNQLFSLLWNMRAASGTNDVFVGLLPPGVPTSGVIGCGGGGVAIAYKDGGAVLAQEIGHAFGRAHAPCGNPGGPDANYPTYGSYPSGSIGEFGFDGATSQIFDPASTYDFMSYCGPVWTSPYTYAGLRSAIAASPAAAHPDAAGGRNAEREYLFLNYRMFSSGEVELLPSFHLNGGAPTRETGPESGVTCDLMGPDGEVLETHRCSITNPHMDPEGPVIEFHEAVPWFDAVESLVFRRGGEVCHKLEVEASAPELRAPVIEHTDRGPSIVRLAWGATAHAGAQNAVRYVVRYSHDAGKTWRAVGADLADSRLTVNLDLLPGGRGLFQVVASAGVRTSTATTEPIEVPRKARQAHILAPEDGTTVAAGEDVEFLGGGFSPDFETVEGEDVTWTSNRDGNIGTGYQLITRRLSPGRHQITASLPDGMRGEARVSVGVTVR